MDFCFVLLLLSFCIKTAEFDSIKCANCDNQQQNGNSSIFEELRQMYGKDQQMQVTKFICEADKIYGILEAIKTEKPICCNLAKNDEYNFIKKRITLINHNDPPLSQMMDTLIVKLMSVKKAMESGFIFAAITLSYWQVICEDVINFINLTREALNNFQITRNDNTMLLDAFDQFPSIAVDNESDCAICLDQIHAGIHVKQLPSCEHIFHDECIKAWIQGGHNACPMCRQQLLAEAQNEHQMDGIASGAEMGNSSNDPSVIVQIDEAHQSETSDEEDEADQSAENTQMANMA
ncbi:hypothetical protein niasHT_025247 [Heterodera trifolii]|uniref:RING-type domain-containing protein n=1 Tax=Heterodera trifolii TaxID=157864 RepID=A0ABD2JGR5_9BILA